MEQSNGFYCLGCQSALPIEKAVKVFHTGYFRDGNTDYHLGLCDEHIHLIIEEAPNAMNSKDCG